MTTRLCLTRWCGVLLALVSISGVARAQVLYGSLTGNVTDPAGAAVPGAKVEAANQATGISRQTVTDVRGVYVLNNLQAGTYTLTTQASGFQAATTERVVVNVNEVRRIDFKMTISQAKQAVEVSAAAAILQTDKADVHSEITSQ
jgi:Carboxypeptidase regulatory-like domain